MSFQVPEIFTKIVTYVCLLPVNDEMKREIVCLVNPLSQEVTEVTNKYF